MADWYLYMIRDRCGCLYTGITTDVHRRFREHCCGSAKAARYTRFREGLKLVYSCRIGTHSLAAKAEYRLKQRSKKIKEETIAENWDCNKLRRQLGL
ncbi:MAG: hypothetical protein CSA26_06190 [Desulfobacterales bacterium]|nr:MAG: hypothetical protein CSA26_06190 [Desulfobacterales bacterium]